MHIVTDEAYSDAKALGFLGDVESRVRRMADRSAPVTHELGNRRFEGYVLQITKDSRVLRVSLFDY